MKAHRVTTQAFLLFVLFFTLFLVCAPHQALCQGGISGAPALYATRKAGPTALRMTRRTATGTRGLIRRSLTGTRTGLYRRVSRSMYAPRYSTSLRSRMAAFQGWGTRTRRVARGAGLSGYPLTTRARMYGRVSLGDGVFGRKRRMAAPLFSSYRFPQRQMAVRRRTNWLGGIEGRLLTRKKSQYRPMSLYTSRMATGYPFALGSGMRYRAMNYTGRLALSRKARERFSGWNNRIRVMLPNY